MRVCVIGGGVIGLTCAVRLAEAGHDVHVVTAEPATESVSAIAAAMWFPYRAFPQDRVLAWSMTSLPVFAALANDPATGVFLRRGTQLHRRADPDLWWAQKLTSWDRLQPAGLAGITPPNPAILGGLRVHLPIIVMGRYLQWLHQRSSRLGVRITPAKVESVSHADPTADAVVLAVGLAARELAADLDVVPIRGQVVRLANPGLTDWLLDEDDPAHFCYVIPRVDDVVCGGTAEIGDHCLDPDPRTEAAILQRARALVPELADASVRSRAVGLRPGRSQVRLERCDELDSSGRPVVACYGHGGAGVTMSWGCADEVAAMISAPVTD